MASAWSRSSRPAQSLELVLVALLMAQCPLSPVWCPCALTGDLSPKNSAHSHFLHECLQIGLSLSLHWTIICSTLILYCLPFLFLFSICPLPFISFPLLRYPHRRLSLSLSLSLPSFALVLTLSFGFAAQPRVGASESDHLLCLLFSSLPTNSFWLWRYRPAFRLLLFHFSFPLSLFFCRLSFLLMLLLPAMCPTRSLFVLS